MYSLHVQAFKFQNIHFKIVKKMITSSSFIVIFCAALFCTSSAHTWLDKITCEATGAVGYPRNYVGHIDRAMTYKIEGRPADAPICGPNQQAAQNPTNFPRLACPAGSRVTFEYTPNGHVSVDQCIANDPRGCAPDGLARTTQWSVHFAPGGLNTRSQVNTVAALNDYTGLQNVVGTGSYDDGQCGERRSGQPCKGSFTIPADLPAGSVNQFVWYWIFDRDPNANGEEYTTCFDVNIGQSDAAPGGTILSQGIDTSSTPDVPIIQAPESSSPTPVPVDAMSTSDCAVSSGDGAVGISAYSDASCPNAVGCFEDGTTCRFCKSQDTPQSSHFVNCP